MQNIVAFGDCNDIHLLCEVLQSLQEFIHHLGYLRKALNLGSV